MEIKELQKKEVFELEKLIYNNLHEIRFEIKKIELKFNDEFRRLENIFHNHISQKKLEKIFKEEDKLKIYERRFVRREGLKILRIKRQKDKDEERKQEIEIYKLKEDGMGFAEISHLLKIENKEARRLYKNKYKRLMKENRMS